MNPTVLYVAAGAVGGAVFSVLFPALVGVIIIVAVAAAAGAVIRHHGAMFEQRDTPKVTGTYG